MVQKKSGLSGDLPLLIYRRAGEKCLPEKGPKLHLQICPQGRLYCGGSTDHGSLSWAAHLQVYCTAHSSASTRDQWLVGECQGLNSCRRIFQGS